MIHLIDIASKTDAKPDDFIENVIKNCNVLIIHLEVQN